jgi:SPP1 family predicted phage head-tail adaptor
MKCCEITAGDLRHFVELQRATDAPDGQGGTVRTWATFATCRAKMIQISAREAVQLAAIRSPIVARCVIRYRADIAAKDCVLFNGRRYAITGAPVDLEFARRWLEINLEGEAPT